MSDKNARHKQTAAATEPHVSILMGVLNGAGTLDEQLASFSAQDYPNWSLIASDDGSTDRSRALITRFAETAPDHVVSIVDGPRLGFAMNFLSLIAGLDDHTDFAALSDQDDVWLPGRLSRGIGRLGDPEDTTPTLYLGRTMICGADLTPIRPSPDFRRPPGFGNALVQCIGGGNTMMLNRAAISLVASVAPRLDGLFAHDWWLYQLITSVGGRVVYDREPMVLYRQHPTNQIGRNDTPRAAAQRLVRLLGGQFSAYLDSNLAALTALCDVMTPEARRQLECLQRSRQGQLFERLEGLREAGLYRQRPHETLALYVSAFLGRL